MHSYAQLSFSTIIPDVVSRFAQNNALGYVNEKPMTYAQMGKQIEAVKAFLEASEIIPGDRVAIYSQNMPNWGVVYFALQCMGVVAVPVLPDFNSFELQNVLNHSEAKAIFISKSLEFKLKEVKSEFVELIVRIDDFNILEGGKQSFVFDENAKCTNTYQPDENELAILLYTSGTTGESKGVMLSQKNVISNAFQTECVQKILDTDKFLSVLPLSHTYENTIGLILPILNGAHVTYLTKPPVASVLLPAMQSVKPTLMLTVPLIIEKVFKASILPTIQKKTATRIMHKYKLTRKLLYRIAGKKLYQTFGGNLKFFGIGGAKLDPQVEQFLRDAKFPYSIGYGLTETAPLLAGSAPFQTKFQAIGPNITDCELKINNPDPKTGEGEIWAKGPNVMLGYYKSEAKTKEVITEDGWFKTGDLGVYDKKGYLSHKGRLKNLIVGANGENIYPEEIESLINNFRHVVESIVVEQKGKLVALVHFDREELELKLKGLKSDISNKVDDKIEEIGNKVDQTINELAEELQEYINARVNKFSRIQLLIVHPDPFHKTATKKIKRYLYA
ncbi:MAG: AMP-binding protein [Bacteroidales bacterium]|jgi:long-chain acyl-CoA synthetase|nr:AMP-binding protein [Bacteroidales bacterium]